RRRFGADYVTVWIHQGARCSVRLQCFLMVPPMLRWRHLLCPGVDRDASSACSGNRPEAERRGGWRGVPGGEGPAAVLVQGGESARGAAEDRRYLPAFGLSLEESRDSVFGVRCFRPPRLPPAPPEGGPLGSDGVVGVVAARGRRPGRLE